MANIKDMTEGKPLRLMIGFAVPLLLANALQMFYTIADSAIVGRILGVSALASIGATASPYWLVYGAVLSTTQGFGVVFAQRFGAKDMDGLRRAFVTAVCLAAAFSAVFGCIGALGSRFMLRMLNTPPVLLDGAVTYLSWLLGGIFIAFAYSLMGSMLRALGDSKTPMRGMMFSSMLNIALDLALIIPFGVKGAAAAALLAQSAACVYCFLVLRKSGVLNGCVFKWDTDSAAAMLRLGLPLGFRSVIIEAGGLVVQLHVNNYGMEFVAGIAVAKRMYGLLLIAASALEATNATYTAQNYGAGNYKRVKQGIFTGGLLTLAAAAAIMAFTLPLGRFILGLLIEGEPGQITAVLDIGVRQLTALTLGLPVLHLLFLYRSALEGIGKPLFPTLSGFMELGFRVSSVLLLTPIMGEWGIFLSDPAGWVAAAGLLVVSYYFGERKARLII